MKKEKFLKYLILICSMMISFFILANVKVSAIDYMINDKISFSLEQADSQDVAKGYIISGASTTCEENDSDCVVDLELPTIYVDGDSQTEDYPIVGIKDSENGSISGVLQSLSKVVSGKITVGGSIKTIGSCAFCNFSNVSEYELGEYVSSIGEYAFSNNAGLEIIVIKAYDHGITQLANKNAFNSSLELEKFVFKNDVIATSYEGSDVWKEINQMEGMNVSFTFKILYRFHKENGDLYETVEFYNGELIEGKLPVAPVTKIGLNFNWESSFNGKEISSNSTAYFTSNDVTYGPIHDIVPNWTLKQATLSFRVGFGGIVQDYENNEKVEVVYGGKNKKMNIEAIVDHELLNDENFTVSYAWVRITDTQESLNVTTSSVSVFRVVESGTYKCTIMLNYSGYDGISKPIGLDVIIRPVEITINVKDTQIEYGTFINEEIDDSGDYYDVDKESLIEGETIKSIKFNGYNQKSVVDVYPEAMKLDRDTLVIGYENDLENYVDNYNVSIVDGDLTIVPKVVELKLDNDIEIEYGEEEILTKDTKVNVFGEEVSLIIEYFREDEDNKNVGRYEVVSAIVFNQESIDNNYSVVLGRTNAGKIVIVPRKVNVSWIIDENLVYSGIKKSASASYKDVGQTDINLKIDVFKGTDPSVLVNAGVYKLVATQTIINNNYELVGFEKEIEIEKADSVFIGDQRQIVTYNGLPQRVNVSLNHSEGTISYGDYSSCKNAHLSISASCTISVSVEATENYKAISGNFYLHIKPYEMEVVPDVFEFNYGTIIGQYNLNNTYEGVNGEKVIVYFAKSGSHSNLDVGYYDIASAYLSNNTNYKVTMVQNTGSNKIKISPAPVEIRFYLYEGLVYDGTVKNIGIRTFGTEEDIGLVVDYGEKNIIKNAGDYRIDVSLTNTNFYIVGDNYLEFSIAKATYDLSNVKLNSTKKTFNFKNHFIKLDGDLPEGVTPVYTIDGEYGNGTFLPFKHTIKVTFEGDFENYNYIEPLMATLNIDMSWVWITLALIVFVGIGIPVAFYLLVKYKVIRFRKRIKRSVVRKLIKRSRELDALNEMFRGSKEESLKEKEDEEVVIIEEPVKFIKKPAVNEPEYSVELSFIDELFKSSYGTKQFYSEVKNEILSYDGIVSKIKRDYETFYLNNIPVAKLDVVDGILYAYFALDPTMYKESEYKHSNVSKEKDFASVPLKLKVDSIDSLRHAKMFVRIIRKKEGLKFISNFIRTDYVSVYTAKENSFKLFKKVFVKKGSKEELED